jgi:type VI secretion system protein ImpL
MSERKISGYWIAVIATTALVAILAWFFGAEIDPARTRRVCFVLMVGGLILSQRAHLSAAWRFVALHAPIRKRKKYQRDPMARVGAGGQDDSAVAEKRSNELRAALENYHGRNWRYHHRWVMVAGDESLVARLAPGLPDAGYAIEGNAVLLYASQSGAQLNNHWLDQIRRLRGRRPVDAVVGVVTAQTAGNQPFDAKHIAERLVRHARAVRWSAPAYLLNASELHEHTVDPNDVIGCTWSNARTRMEEVSASLRTLSTDLAEAGVIRLAKDLLDRSAGDLSKHIAQYEHALADLVTQIGQSRVWRSAVHGILFAPLAKKRTATIPGADEQETGSDATPSAQSRTNNHDAPHAVWQTIANHSRHIHGRRIGFSPWTTTAWTTTALLGAWIAGTMLSGFANRTAIQAAVTTAEKLAVTQDRTQSAQFLDALQNQLDTLEVHQHDGAPWYTRFGLNHDAALFAALWPAYESGAARIVIAPIRAQLEDRLRQLASLSDAEIASGGDAQIQSAYNTLKTYLMLAKPEHADAKFLTPQLFATGAPARPLNSPLSEGAWQDLRQHLAAFYANHLGQRVSTAGTSLAIIPDAGLVSGARQTVVGVRGIQNSTDTVYQQILDDAKPKYPPASLATLLGDTSSRGLFNTTATVPGVFTRAAWDERISKAIDDASEQGSVAGDWVLSETRTNATPTASLKAELRQRYFDDYARAWQEFLNTVRWQPTPTLSGTVDQLTLLGDPQRSPLVALMNVIVFQAGAGAVTQSLSDSLINKAQQLVGADESSKANAFGARDPSKLAEPQDGAPLASAFGPLLRLTGSDLAPESGSGNKANAQMATTGDLSLARYLERVTAMRLKLQQIMMGNDPDAMSRAAAQAVLQGKTADIADSRDYAGRVAASLGQQWAGLGDLFQQPLDQTWQVVLQPAAASLNDTWRSGILADWNRNFGGRYPFADSDNDASLPEMARFMRPDGGVIAQFVSLQLAGVVERQGDRWVPAQGSGHNSLSIDPNFLSALNTLMRVSTSIFPSGDARVRFELRAVPTPGVTDMKFVLAGRELHYFNQKEEWTPFVWPGDTLESISRIEWQTEQGGLRSALDTQGRFGLIRLLERATITPQDNARFLLAWTPDQSQGIPLKVQLRSEAGAGPLDILALRHFGLPQRIFLTGSPPGMQKQALSGPPPLPEAMLEAARYAEVPLPPGMPGTLTLAGMANAAGTGNSPETADKTHTDPVPQRAAVSSTAEMVAKGATSQPPAAPKLALTAPANDQRTSTVSDDEGIPLSEVRKPGGTRSAHQKPGLASRTPEGPSKVSDLTADSFIY